MCGRYTHTLSWQQIHDLYRLTVPKVLLNLQERYNVCPTQEMPVVVEGRELKRMKWGLILYWSKDGGKPYTTINARAESVKTKPAFREPFKRRRCLVPASGFYEWRQEDGVKQPYYITLKDGPMTFAGLWDTWKGPEGPVETYTIVTTTANDTLKELHDRMPVILPEKQWEPWLDHATSPDEAEKMLQPYPAGAVTFHKVERAVGNVRNDYADLIKPA